MNNDTALALRNERLPTLILRFNGYGVVQYIVSKADGAVICVDGSTKIVELLDAGSVVNVGRERVRICRAEKHLDGELVDSVNGFMNMKWSPFFDTNYYKMLKSEGQLQKILDANMVNLRSLPIGLQSRHGTQRLLAVLRGTERFLERSAISANLKQSARESARKTVRMQFNPELATKKQYKTKYSVIDMDTFGAAVSSIDSNPQDKVMIVNFASNHAPGGGYRTGASAQEEDLFRCSTLTWSLGTLRNSGLYPVNNSTTANALYTPQCHILRDRKDFSFFSDEQIRRYAVSVCSIAAFNVNNPNDKTAFMAPKSNVFSPSGERVAMNRIRMMFQMAVLNAADVLITGAFGCGAFHNNPKVIIDMFNQVMKEYDGAIKHVQFAIIGNNFDIFRKGLSFPT